MYIYIFKIATNMTTINSGYIFVFVLYWENILKQAQKKT